MTKEHYDRHGGNLFQAARISGKAVAQFLDFSANINPLGISSQVLQSISQSLPLLSHYPDAQAYELKKAISEFYRVPFACVTPGNGAVELMYILCYLLRPRSVLVTAPAFSEYERAARASGALVRRIYLTPERDFVLDVDEVIRYSAGMDIVFVGNPNNPTGTLTYKQDIEKILSAALKSNTWVVIDEAFMDFLLDDSAFTCREFLTRYENLVISHSLTKFYAIPGLRLGFSLTNPELAKRLHVSKDQWNVNLLAQLSGVAALGDKEYQQKSKESMKIFQTQLYKELEMVPGLKPYKPAANYILIDIHNTGLTACQMEERLLTHNVLIRNCENYPGLSTDYVRTAVKLPEQNRKLVEAIKSIVGDVK